MLAGCWCDTRPAEEQQGGRHSLRHSVLRINPSSVTLWSPNTTPSTSSREMNKIMNIQFEGKKVTRSIIYSDGDFEEALNIVRRDLFLSEEAAGGGERMANEGDAEDFGTSYTYLEEDVSRAIDIGHDNHNKTSIASDVGFARDDVVVDDFTNCADNDVVERDVDVIVVPIVGLAEFNDGADVITETDVKRDCIGEYSINEACASKLIHNCEVKFRDDIHVLDLIKESDKVKLDSEIKMFVEIQTNNTLDQEDAGVFKTMIKDKLSEVSKRCPYQGKPKVTRRYKKMNANITSIDGKTHGLGKGKSTKNFGQFPQTIAQNQMTGKRMATKHNGGGRNTATSAENLCMKTWMMLLSSIWLLRILSTKMLLMVVLVNVLSSTFTTIPVVGAESPKTNEKGTTSQDIPKVKSYRGSGVIPVFLEPVPNVTVSVGRDASLTCTVDHLGMHKVAWIHLDRQMILSIHNHVITRTPRFSVTHDSHKTWTLHVTQVKEEDRGHYMCQVNTRPMISQTGFLQVVVPPNILDEESSPSSIVVREKDEVTLTCHGEGFPVPQIKWRREDGQPIETADGRRVGQLDGPTLPLHQVSRMDMGAYLCIATNGVPPSVSKRITLDVEFAPQMHVPNQLVGAPLATEVHLECFVEAHPRAITYWEFQDAMVMNTSRITTDTFEDLYRIHMVLTIRDLQDSDFGTYKCISKNSIAETDGSITLNKTYRPTSPPQTMLHSSDDDSKLHLPRGRPGTDQHRQQLEASRRRYQEEAAEKRQEEEARRTQDLERQQYEHELDQGYRDDKTTRIKNPPIDSGVSSSTIAFSAICWLGLHALPLL